MKTNLLILICVLLISCNKSEEEFIPQAIEKEEKKKVIIYDPKFTGLVGLPTDNGGEHIAYPDRHYYAYTPGGYHDNTLEYPLILFLHGAGQKGDSRIFPHFLDFVLDFGPPRLIEADNWNPNFPCLVVSPQTRGDWHPNLVHNIITGLIKTYRVNKKRIYITGLSMGGRACWFYEGEKGADSYAAALVPICGRGKPSSVENLVYTPIWAFHGEDDTVVKPFSNDGSAIMIPLVNSLNPKFPAKLTMYPGVGHDSWIRTYDNSGRGTESPNYDPFDMTIYNWMFSYRKE